MPQDPQSQINQLKQEMDTLKRLVENHQHVYGDGTTQLRKNIKLDRDQWLSVGQMQLLQQPLTRDGSTGGEAYGSSISLGPDNLDGGTQLKSQNLQIDMIHFPKAPGKSTIHAYSAPLVSSSLNNTVTVSSGGNTVTINGYGFITDELVGALIDIYDSTGVLIETQTISSNTPTVVTITGIWLHNTSGGKFLIYQPVLLGQPDVIFNRVYVQEGTALGGIRFGVGPTSTSAGGQNGLLYMDTIGDLYWRAKGSANPGTKLN